MAIQLVVDRTQAHVDLLNRLRKKGWANMSPSEKNQWYGEAAKGAYNCSDLNRVESAVAELSSIFGLDLSTKTNWGIWDIPLDSEMDRYLGNVVKIRNMMSGIPNLPVLPNNMDGLSYRSANNIEKVLMMAYEYAQTSIQSGEIYSGEV